LLNQANRQQPETDEEAFERKEREKRLQIESDIQNASDLFSGVAVDGKSHQLILAIKKKRNVPTNLSLKFFCHKDGSEPIEKMKPVTKEQFEAYQKRLVETITVHQVR
jgi:translation initiation factor 3 subunit J